MRSFSLTLAVLTVVGCLQFSAQSDCQAQEIIKQMGERHGRPKVNYRPDDPWKRGKVFNLQTGHAGLFYNCDDEECKRNSPYICWKKDYEKMFPTPMGLVGRIKRDCDRVKQRIYDGAGACARDCTCHTCKAKRHRIAASEPQANAPKNALPEFNFDSWSLADKEQPVAVPEVAQENSGAAPRYGLVRGTNVGAEPIAVVGTGKATVNAPSQAQSKSGDQSAAATIRRSQKWRRSVSPKA